MFLEATALALASVRTIPMHRRRTLVPWRCGGDNTTATQARLLGRARLGVFFTALPA